MPPPSRDSASLDADQPRQQVFQLRELDLQLAFARPRAPREDVENELRAIDDLAADCLFDLPQLRRRQLVVEDDDVGVAFQRADAASVLILPAPRNVDGSGFGRSCSTRSTTSAPARLRQPGELVERSFRLLTACAARDQADQRRTLEARVTPVQPCPNLVPRNRAGAHQPRLGVP